MQGVIASYDPETREGLIQTDDAQFDMAANALEASIFRFVRQGQRVVFELDDSGHAINVRTGAEPDMAGPTARV